MATAVRKARTRLAGLGPELKVVAPQICLVDPFPDPSTGEMVTEGSVVDVARREIWMAVTAEVAAGTAGAAAGLVARRDAARRARPATSCSRVSAWL